MRHRFKGRAVRRLASFTLIGLVLLGSFSGSTEASIPFAGGLTAAGEVWRLLALGTGVLTEAFRTQIEREQGNAETTASDPVATVFGQFLKTTLDLFLGGPLPLGFGRFFESTLGGGIEFFGFQGANDGPLARNWIHNFHILLRRIDADNVSVFYYKGKLMHFSKNGMTWSHVQSPSNRDDLGTPFQMVQEGTKLKIMDPELNRISTFETSGMADNEVRGVSTIRDRNGNTHTLTYNVDGTLGRVLDGLGRSLDFVYTTVAGRPRTSEVRDQTGRSIRFTYSSVTPLLNSFTNGRGNTTTYTYVEGAPLLATITRPAGNVTVTNTYDVDTFSILTQTDGVGNTTGFSYVTSGFTPESTTITDPFGNSRIHRFNADFRLESFGDEAGNRIQYEYDSLMRRTATIDRQGDRSTVAYDAASGKVTSRTDAVGNTWTYSYTPQTQEGFTFFMLTRIDFPDGASEAFSYDTSGNLTRFQDRAGQFLDYTYNNRGQAVTAANPSGGVTSFTYNNDGTMASRRDAAGNTTTFGYDTLKRLNRVNRADGTMVEMVRDANDNLVSSTNEKGQTTAYGYDANDNLTSLTNPLGNTGTFEYDANDLRTATTDPLGNRTTVAYDALQRIRTVTDANGNVTTFNYDTRRRLESIVDAEGKQQSFGYDDDGVPASVTDPLGKKTTISTDKLGRTTQIIDPLSSQTQHTYDSLGRRVSETNPLGETVTYGYDARGLLNQVTLPEQITTSYGRNELGQVTQMTDARGKNRSRSYDAQGRPTSVTDALGHTTRMTSYDSRNRFTGIELPSSSLDLAYDAVGLVTNLSYSDGTRLDYTYDAADRLTAANGVSLQYDAADRLIGSNGIGVTRDAGGRIVTMTLAADKTVSYGYDRRNLLATVTDWVGGTTRFSHDDAGRLVSVTQPNGIVTGYTYDVADRLTGITERRGEKTLSSIALTKDGVGRIREAARDVPLEPTALQGKRSLSFDDADRIVGAGYDKMGRLTAGGGRSFEWDLASRLTSYREGQSRVTFTYDAFGNRLTRTQGERTRSMVWNYALGLPSVSVVQDEGIATRYYVHTPGGLLLYSVEAADDARHFYHYDEMGSTLFLSDDGGKVTDSYAYGPYGRLTDSTGTADNPFTFVGQFGVMREPATGLYYMRARYYDSATGRFLSPDPLGEELTDAKSLNLYQYASQNPVRFIDPSGLDESAAEFRARLEAKRQQFGEIAELLSGETNFRQLAASVGVFFQSEDEEDKNGVLQPLPDGTFSFYKNDEFLREDESGQGSGRNAVTGVKDQSRSSTEILRSLVDRLRNRLLGRLGFDPFRPQIRIPFSLRDKNHVDPFARPDRSGIDEVIL